jgi:predicted O-linked N-acetylglucosamine transferase (SPINDLY family)
VAILRLAEGVNSDTEDGKKKKLDYLKIAHDIDPKNAKINHMLGHFFFEVKQFKGAQEHFDLAFKLDEKLVEAAASAIYLRFSICNWGKNGTQYKNDIKSLTDIAKAERDRLLLNNKSHEVSVIHPHMALGYAINSEHKLAISKSYAENEKVIAVWSGLKIFDDTSEESRSQYRSESQKAGFRIKVGYVSANIKSKTTVYMAQVSTISIFSVRHTCVSPVHTCRHQWDEISFHVIEKLSSLKLNNK